MDVPPGPAREQTTFTVLVTGANSGLGFATCCRLIDEFLFTRPQSQTLHLLFSTRDTRKGTDTSRRLNAHLQGTLKKANNVASGISQLLEARVKIENVLVDLLNLVSIKSLATQLLQRLEPIDAIVLNAGIAGWLGLNWPKTVSLVLTDLIHATTYPTYLNCDVGAVARPQHISAAATPEPPLGEVFTANVFGHYLLVHWLAPALDSQTRIVWTSSISAVASTFDPEDLQGLRSAHAYESSKRLTDYLVLTSESQATRASLNAFLPASNPAERPRMYVTHPGVCGTSITGLHWVLDMFMFAAFYLARVLGSPWHLVTAYKGAVAAAFVVLAPPDQLEELEIQEGKGKWGSAVDVFGEERVGRTDVEGWGYCGKVGVVPRGSITQKKGKFRGQKKTTRERREDFEETGRRVWREMEELRKAWETRVAGAEVKVGKSADL